MNAGVTQLVEYQLPMLNVEGSSPFARSPSHGLLVLALNCVQVAMWVFPITKESFQKDSDGKSPIEKVLEATFPRGFTPETSAKSVLVKFENEDGTPWGGEDINLMARFNEFFEWEWVDCRDGSKRPTTGHRPSFLTFRAWQLLRSSVSRRNWDVVPPSDLTVDILKQRGQYFTEGMYVVHGFPSRLTISFSDSPPL